ncbi:MAG: DUF3387 domain-containing protein [Staphylococcus epidermidis]|nr:DUF3387 domain-containing protein [Staphylococcus epidermidis]
MCGYGRGKELGLNSDKIDFYDTLISHETEKEVIGDKNLRAIARSSLSPMASFAVSCEAKAS